MARTLTKKMNCSCFNLLAFIIDLMFSEVQALYNRLIETSIASQARPDPLVLSFADLVIQDGG